MHLAYKGQVLMGHMGWVWEECYTNKISQVAYYTTRQDKG